MGITNFLYLLLVFSIAIIFYDVDQVDNKNEESEKPLVSFYESVVYNIDTKSVNEIIPSKEAYFYKTREEIVDGTIISKENGKTGEKQTNSLRAESMIKIEDDIYLDGNVNVEMANGIHLKTEQLQYNLKTKVAQNEQKFVVTKNFHDFYGSDLYFDTQNKDISAKYVHFKIKVENE